MNNTPTFKPENYPRTYKAFGKGALEFIGKGLMLVAVLAFFDLLYRHHFDVPALLFDQNICFVILPLGFGFFFADPGGCMTLYPDAVQYRRYLVTKSMKRSDIRGTRWVVVDAGQYSTHEVVLLPREKAGKYIVLPMDFKIDEYYDGWIGSLPYLGGVYNNYGELSEKDVDKVEWVPASHAWLPRPKH